MVNILRIFGFVLLMMIVLLVILGLYSSSNIEIENTCHLQAPQSQIWQIITDADKTTRITNKIKFAQFEHRSELTEGSQLKLYLDSKNYICLRVTEFKENILIIFDLLGIQNNPVINDYKITIVLKPLRDGSTEVGCKINYNINNFAGKITNKLYFEENQISMLKQNMDLFKKYLEKI